MTASRFLPDGQEQVSESLREDWLRKIIVDHPIATFAIDSDHKVMVWNRACEALTGIAAADVLGTDRAWSAFYAEKRPQLADLVVDGAGEDRVRECYGDRGTILKNQPGRWEIEAYFPNMWLGPRWLSFTAVAIHDGDGAVVGAIETVRDLSLRKRAELACRESEHRLKQIIDNNPVAIFVIDEEHRITHWNRACEQVTGLPAEQMVGSREAWRAVYDGPRPVLADLLVAGANPEAIESLYGGACQAMPLLAGSWEGLDGFHDGRQWLRFCASPLHGLDGRVVGAIEAFYDVTEKAQQKQELEYRSSHDGLTGLANRSLAMDRLEQALKMARRNERGVALLFIDLDGFKSVNDILGHQFGDELLKEAAGRMLSCLREIDTLARLGGDEFIVVLPDQDGRNGAARIGERLIEVVRTPFRLRDQDTQISASIGIAFFPDDGVDTQSLLRHADAAMYRSKESGRSRLSFFTEDLNRQIENRIAIKNGLKKALEQGEFHLLFQPKSNLQDGRVTGAEALLRWNSPSLGMVSPTVFIPVLEETGEIDAVGQWVIEEACRRQRHWHSSGHDGLRMAVNLSARQLWNPALPQRVEEILSTHGLEPACLELELTESMIMRDAEQARTMLHAFNDMGIHLAMDDFGTGFSSLSYLKRLPIGTIKIDQSFVADLIDDPDDFEIVRTIISMGRSLRRRTVAEGVETEAQRKVLHDLGCDEMQGYLLSRPLSADAMLLFLDDAVGRKVE